MCGRLRARKRCRIRTPRADYVGWTNDLIRRVARHNAGVGARSTRGRSWIVLHIEEFQTREAAMSREWHLKRDRVFRKRLLDQLRTAPARAA